jgi:hemerythrin
VPGRALAWIVAKEGQVVEWNADLSVGIPSIDAQHQELFQRVNRLFAACSEGRAESEVAETLRFLSAYVLEHFADEEAAMARVTYPGAAEHVLQHRELMSRLADLDHRYAAEGPRLDLILAVNRTLVDWLNVHIRRSDRKLAEFLRAPGST